MLHRDVKPTNVLVEARGAGEHAFLADFGLARHVAATEALTRPGEWLGTLDYAAPEQVRGERVDARADVYALACVLHHMLSGSVPFPRESDAAKVWAHLHDDPPPLRGDTRHERLAAIVAGGMAEDPRGRLASAGELARGAEAALSGSSSVRTRRATPRPLRRRRRRPRAAALAAALGLAVAGVLALLSGQGSEPRPPRPGASLGSYRSPAYTARYPAGWRVAEDEAPLGAFRRTRFVGPQDAASVLVDRTPGGWSSVTRKAREVEAVTARSPGYRRVRFRTTALAGRPGFAWTFAIGRGPAAQRVDYFRAEGSDGYAILGTGRPSPSVAAAARLVASSIRAR